LPPPLKSWRCRFTPSAWCWRSRLSRTIPACHLRWLALAHTSHAFTFFSPFLGWLGVFLTGSDTSSNALFAALQATAAQQIGVSDVLLVAANTTGGVTGKMISPQSIACAAVGLVGKESDLFRFTVKHSLIFTCMVGVITTLQAYVLTWMIP
jgi:L-lactate permease